MSVKQLGRRLLQIVIVLIGISFFTFILTYLAPGDPVRTRYAASGMVPTEKELQEERERLGLNDPVLVQYGRWLGKVLHGDFGTSYSNGKPVAELLSVRLLPTLKLAFSALILMLLVAVPLGMLSAVYKNTWVDYLVRGVTFLGVSIPNFWVGLILLYVVALKFSLLSVISTGDGFEKIILPAITLAFAKPILSYRIRERSTHTVASVVMTMLASALIVACLDAQMAGILQRYTADYSILMLIPSILLCFIANDALAPDKENDDRGVELKVGSSAVPKVLAHHLFLRVLGVLVFLGLLYSTLICFIPETGWYSDVYAWAYQDLIEMVEFWT